MSLEDYEERLNSLKEQAGEILNDKEADLSDYKAFFIYHDESKVDFIEDFNMSDELKGLFADLPELCAENEKNHSFFKTILCFFVKSECPKLKAKELIRKSVEKYDEIMMSLDSNRQIA